MLKQPRYQKYRDSRNLLDEAGRENTFTKNNIRYFYPKSASDMQKPGLQLKAGVTYTLQVDPGNYSNPSGIYFNRRADAYSTPNLALAYGIRKLTYTPDQDYDVSIDVYWADSVKPDDLTNVKVWVVEGSEPLPYEPYGVKIPDGIGENADIVPFHSDHRPVEVSVGRKSRNLFEAAYFQGSLTSFINGNLTFSIDPNNGVRINGTSNGTYPQQFIYGKNKSIMHEIEPGHTYTLSYRADGNPTGGKFYFMVRAFADDKSTLVYSQTTWLNNASKTFGSQAKYLELLAVAEGLNVTWNNFLVECIQIEEGTTAHPYEKPGTVTDPLYTPRLESKSGSTIEFEDSYNYECEVEIDGKSEQKQLSGKNLINWGNMWAYYVYSKIGENSFVLKTGDGRGWHTILVDGVGTYLKAGTYTLSINLDSFNPNSSPHIECKYGTETNTVSALSKSLVLGKNVFTLNILIDSYVGIKIFDANYISDADFAYVSNPMVEKGSSATEYEPYCGGVPSPNPDYPQEIVSFPQKSGYGVKFNQIATPIASARTVDGLTFTPTPTGCRITGNVTEVSHYVTWMNLTGVKKDHVYLQLAKGLSQDGKKISTENFGFRLAGTYYTSPGYYLTDNGVCNYIQTATSASNNLSMKTEAISDIKVDITVTAQVFDLTEMFGAGHEPETVEEFIAMFPEAYYSFVENDMRYLGEDYITSYPMVKPYENPVITSHGRNLCTQDPTKVPYKYSVNLSEIIKDGEYFTVTFEQDKTDISASTVYFHAPDGSYSGSNYVTLNKVGKVTKTLKAKGNIGLFRVYNNGGLGFVKNVMIERGSVAHPYEPYHATPITIDLQGNKLRSLPDGTNDTLRVYRDGRVELVKRVDRANVASVYKSIAFIQTAHGSYIHGGMPANAYVPTAIPDSQPVLCNIVPVYKNCGFDSSTASANKQPCCGFYANSNFRVFLPTSYGITGADAFKEYLSSVGAYIIYRLKEPQTIQLPSIDPIPQYYPTTILDGNGNDITGYVTVVDNG